MKLRATLHGLTAVMLVAGLAACSGRQTVDNNSTTRALDRVSGTDVSGAYPGQRNGTPNNPPGTAATRAFDRAAGTDTSGAYPAQRDGTPGNPPGTAVGRIYDRTVQ